MRRLALAAAVFAAPIAIWAGPAFAQALTVRTDQAVRIALPAPAKDVAVGNAAIADVTVMDSRNILVIGKAAGMTNIVVLDAAGRLILDRAIMVSPSDVGQVSIYKGPNQTRLVCAPTCVGEDAPAAAAAPTP